MDERGQAGSGTKQSAQGLLDRVPHVLIAAGQIVSISPSLHTELGTDPAPLVGMSIQDVGTRLDDHSVDELLGGQVDLRVRLGPACADRPVLLRYLGTQLGHTVIEMRSLADEFRLESLLRRSDYAHMLLSPQIELQWSMTSNDLAAALPGDDPTEWIELMDPDDMTAIGNAVLEVGDDPGAERIVRHRLNADRTYSVIDFIESAIHDPDLRGVLIRSRLEDDVVGKEPVGTGQFAGIAVSDHMPIGVIMATDGGRILHRNAVAADLIGARAGLSALPTDGEWLLSTLDEESARAYESVFVEATNGRSGHCTIPSPRGEELRLRVSASPSAASTVVLVVEDMTELAHAEEAVRKSNRLLEALDMHSEELVLVFDANGEARYTSSSVDRRANGGLAPAKADDMLRLVHPDDRSVVTDVYDLVRAEAGRSQSIDVRVLVSPTGSEARWHHGTVTNLLDDPEIQGLVWTLQDVHERHLAELDLQFRATHDDLTALPGRATVQSQLDRALSRDRLADRRTAVIFCDVDHFKQINDSLGHRIGDLVLTEVATRLQAAVREIDVVGRFGGDEFVIVAPGLISRAEAISLAERVFESVCGPAVYGEIDVEVSVSLGVAVTGQSAEDSHLMQQADTAMYAAKRAGRGRISLYSPSMDRDIDSPPDSPHPSTAEESPLHER